MTKRIEHLLVLEQTEVQVRPRVPHTGLANHPEHLPREHLVADSHVVSLKVCIETHDAIAVVDLHEEPLRPHVTPMHEERTPGLERDVRASPPVDARERDHPRGDREHGFAGFRGEVNPSVNSSSAIARFTKSTRRDAGEPLKRAHELDPRELSVLALGSGMALEETPPSRQDSVLRPGVPDSIAPYEVRDRMPMRNGIERSVDVRTLLPKHANNRRGVVQVGFRVRE